MGSRFPFLIGTVRTDEVPMLVGHAGIGFPFLIGTVRTHSSSIYN